MNEQRSEETRLAFLRQLTEDLQKTGSYVKLTTETALALIDCAEIVHTDYLLLSDSQRMKALGALKVLTDG